MYWWVLSYLFWYDCLIDPLIFIWLYFIMEFSYCLFAQTLFQMLKLTFVHALVFEHACFIWFIYIMQDCNWWVLSYLLYDHLIDAITVQPQTFVFVNIRLFCHRIKMINHITDEYFVLVPRVHTCQYAWVCCRDCIYMYMYVSSV